jgi:hypothetical protein
MLYFLAMSLQRPDYVGLLWRDPMGVKMTIGVAVRLAVGAAIFLGGCTLLNRFARAPWGTGATIAQVGLTVAWVVLFCVPVAFVVTVGPAAIQIQKNLLKD